MPTVNAASPLILNVDDSDGGRYVKSRILRLAGYTVIEAMNGQEALDKALAQQPLLVLLDTKLPDINGLEVCRRLKTNPATANILVLQTSAALVETVHRVRALDGGADSYLAEPIEAEELVASVRALLRIRHAEDAQRAAVQAMAESEERFRQLAESVNDVFWIYEPVPARFIYVSPAYEREWRRDSQALYTDPREWFSNVQADDRAALCAAFARLADGESYQAEYLQHGPSQDRWIAERAFPIATRSGQALRIAGISQDVTVRTKADLELKQSDRRKDEFLAMLAHELRNPLEPIRSAAALLARQSGQGSAPAQKAVAVIERQVSHLTRLVEDLLDVSRITHGKVRLRLEPVRLDDVIEAAVEANLAAAENRRLVIDVRASASAIWVMGDRVRLTQVFSNLVHNATKFSTDGGLIAIDTCVNDVARQVCVSVRDEGSGISADIIASVFDLFTQATQSLARDHGGLGIGLSVVRTLIESHGGTVSVHSDGSGQGSEFMVTLPIIDAPASAAAAAGSAMPGTPRRILLVDDNRDAGESMQALLSLEGHMVTLASSGQASLDAIARAVPDVVILDIGLPDMSGYEVAKRIHGSAHAAMPVLVALTGYGSDTDRQKIIDAGFDHYLTKPADYQTLLSILSAAG